MSMSRRDKTSTELPSALSGSKELIEWPGVASTRTIGGCCETMSGPPCAETPEGCTIQQPRNRNAAARMNRFRGENWVQNVRNKRAGLSIIHILSGTEQIAVTLRNLAISAESFALFAVRLNR